MTKFHLIQSTHNNKVNSKKHLILSEVIPRKRQRRKRRYLRSMRLSKSYVSPWYKIQAMWTNCSAKISFFPPKCDSAIGQHFHKNQDCDAAYDDKQFTVKAVARFSFYQATLEATFMKNKQPTLFRQEEVIYAMQSVHKHLDFGRWRNATF